MRSIDDILFFRSDLSPFLVHLSRDQGNDGLTAGQILRNILHERQLRAGSTLVSDARFGMRTNEMTPDERTRLLAGVCFTETPLNEIHSLLEIRYRRVNLAPYGLVFLKDRLRARGVSPVLAINNEGADKDAIVQALCSLRTAHPAAAAEVLPLVSIFGRKLTPPGAPRQDGRVDFLWEREWRYPASRGVFTFAPEDVFIGLCPDEQIQECEEVYQPIGFVDPRRNMKWYATKLIQARQRLNIRFSVV